MPANSDVDVVFVGTTLAASGLGRLGASPYEVAGYGSEGDPNCKGLLAPLGKTGDKAILLARITADDGITVDCCGLPSADDEGAVG